MPNLIQIANGQHAKILENGRPFLNGLEARLFVADVVPSGVLMPTLAQECTDSGYAATPAPISGTFPTVAVTNGPAGEAVSDFPTITFSHGSGNFTVYGVFWTDPADSDVVVMAQRMDVPFEVTAAGQVFVITGPFHLITATS